MKGRLSLLVGKTLWTLALLLAAVLATGLQMDRTARKDIHLARMVPPVFRAYALEPLASRAYVDRRGEQALGYSRELVLRRPVPAEGLALLTRGLVVVEDEKRAVSALVLSAQRGWRSTFTQILIVNSALATGDMQTAAQRILALWRLRRKNPEVSLLTEMLLSSDGGQDAFATGLVHRDAWLDDFLQWAVARRVPSRAFAVVGPALAEGQIAIDCRRLANSVRVLARSGRPHDAQSLWSQLCMPGGSVPADDFAFHEETGLPSIFGWNYPQHARLTTEVIAGKYGKGLRYENNEHILADVAWRVTLLKPGMHNVRIETNPTDNLSADPVVLQLTCYANDDAAQKPVRLWVRNEPVAFTIPASGCAGQEVALLVGHGKGLIQRLSVD